MEIHKKGYEINTSNLDCRDEAIQCGYLETIVADNEREARKKALVELIYNGIENDYLDEPLTYISVKVRRNKDADLFMVDGKPRNREQIKADIERKDRDDGFRKLLITNPNDFAYIRKGGSYYRPNSCGYTERKDRAGVYTIERAVNECLGMSLRDCMYPVLIDKEVHNKMINEEIESLKSRLIA